MFKVDDYLFDRIELAYFDEDDNDKLIVSCMAYDIADLAYKRMVICIPNFKPDPSCPVEIDEFINRDKVDIEVDGDNMSLYVRVPEKLTTPEEYIKKWNNHRKEYTKKFGKDIGSTVLAIQEKRWSDWLWLGRHLFLKHSGVFETCNKEIRDRAFEEEKKIIKKYEDDADFIRCMLYPETEDGDEEWEEIRCNVGALRKILFGEWNTDS